MEFVDIQVNGYAGVSFHENEAPTEEQMQLVIERLLAGGVRAILPTVTTNAVPFMAERLAHLRRLIDQDADLRRMMPAFHIEGPCLSPVEGYRGAHPEQHCIPATREVLDPLLDAAGGVERVAMVTLAPECDRDLATTRWLSESGIIVCAGHTDAPLDMLREAEQAGLSFFTHLGNGSAATMDRHDNIINRAMALEHVRYSLVADGHHVPFFVLAQYIRLLGIERCIFTSDCIAAADAPPDCKLNERFEVDWSTDTPVVRLKGTPYLGGAALTMAQAHRNATEHLGLTAAEAKALCDDQPAALISKWLRD
ncbi:MAG: N-acetylglucosamine-6-phosphate deacetylase [Phycisphaeraceae bacterium]|nr:N-acetylglucosamine-6-phosphate deacetylase [Phycisphaeraceae bacterium]